MILPFRFPSLLEDVSIFGPDQPVKAKQIGNEVCLGSDHWPGKRSLIVAMLVPDVQATDAAGNVELTPATFNWKIQ